jgi:hypothetical protein
VVGGVLAERDRFPEIGVLAFAGALSGIEIALGDGVVQLLGRGGPIDFQRVEQFLRHVCTSPGRE